MTSAGAVNISWTQPNGSIPVDQYEVALSRVTGEGQLLCDSTVDNRSIFTLNTSIQYFFLHEFSNYTVRVTAITLNIFATTTANFVTLPSGK